MLIISLAWYTVKVLIAFVTIDNTTLIVLVWVTAVHIVLYHGLPEWRVMNRSLSCSKSAPFLN